MTTYILTPWVSTEGRAAWCAYHSRSWAGATPSFRMMIATTIVDVTFIGLAWSQALDTEAWSWFDNRVADPGGTYVTYSNNSAFPAGDIYIAPYPLYSHARALAKVQGEWLASSYCTDTASGTNGILGATAARSDGIYGRIVPALQYLGFKLTNLVSGNPHNKIVLLGSHHPMECLASWELEGAVEFLLSADAMAVTLRDWCDFYIYPMISAQGRWAGCSYSQPQNHTIEPGTQWATPGTLENVDAHKTYIAADTGSHLEAGIDFHAGYYAAPDGHSNDMHNLKHPEFIAAMQALDATFVFDEIASAGTARGYFETLDDAGSLQLAVAVEANPKIATRPSLASVKAYGANYMKALYTLLVNGDFPHGPP